ncbi:MAG: ribonuclease E/G [Sphingomonas sp.]|nr:ribonuclease E/G [Sphingomonas sp.]
MLIDARHREETRVAVVKGTRIEEFDFESAERKQLKGNIYLAKVTRVEPSLQAAFVDYGGNRHGFLAFSEIHPDYYQIPKEDRDALLREEAEHAAEEAALRDSDDDDLDADEAEDGGDDDHRDDETGEEEGGRRPRKRGNGGSDDAVEALRQRRMNLRRRYKIQDVIRRRQILLVQVVKEERGNKGAALTTYLSLAGRYCVLMPNTAHGGGISRKISNAADRKRLKSIMSDLKLPPSMGCIVRTAGLQRTKTEIKRDFDYLARLWDEIREKTLSSSAPALVYGDSDLIKRAIRDIYNREIDEVIVEGGEGFRHAKDFMKLLMPSHARRVKHYADPVPLFQRHHVEDQLAAMYHPVVQLKSGGYLVINPTEALVSIDINSGRATREHNIEQTATQTNLEAAEEIARQLRLRDMAGLVVIDFIDMDNSSNVRKVEKAMKEALKNDRARIQVGRISSFGLMEMSRQRLRTGVLEASTRQCPHCEGTGLVRTASSAGLSALRLLEDEAARGRGSQLLLRASQEAAFYLLNRKRAELAEIEERYGVTIEVAPDGEREGARMSVEASGPPPVHAPRLEPMLIEADDDEPEIEAFEDEDEEEEAIEREPREARDAERGDRDGSRRKRRRRRGRRGRRGDEGEAGASDESGADEGDAEDAGAEADEDAEPATVQAGAEQGDDGGRRARRRRNRRRRGRGGGEGPSNEQAGTADALDAESDADADGDTSEQRSAPAPATADAAPVAPALTDDVAAGDAPKPKRTRRRKAAPEAPEAVEAPVEVAEETPAEAKPKRTRRKKVDAEAEAAPEAAPVPEPVAASEAPAKPKRPRRKKADAGVETAPEPVAADIAVAEAPAVASEAEAEPEGAAAGANDDGGTPPQPRRGWWQRTFGG